MIYDMRIYTAHPGKERAMIDRFTIVVVPIFTRLGIEVITVYETQEDAPKLIYITRFAGESERSSAWNAFKTDPGWLDAKASSETEGGPLLKQQETLVMLDISFKH